MNQAERMTRDEGEREESKAAGPVYRSVKTVDEDITIKTVFQNNTKEHNMEIVNRTTVPWLFDYAPSLPNFPLDKFKIEIRSDPNIVAVRISESLQMRSVVAVFKNASALCTTSSLLKYVIYLYASPGGTTTVEVLRQEGCGFAFRTERESVLNSAKGLGAVTPSNLPYQMKIPEQFLTDYKPPKLIEQERLLSRSVDRLQCKHIDEKIFCLQNLASITSCDKVNSDAAIQMSELILRDNFQIFTAIATILGTYDQMQDDDDASYQILNACLNIVSNSMETLSQNNSLQSILSKSLSDHILQQIVSSLVAIVRDCRCPHNTAIALTCFRLILENTTAANEYVTEKTCNLIKEAETIGGRTHQNLFLAAKSTFEACTKAA
jgi:hypothetical protein